MTGLKCVQKWSCSKSRPNYSLFLRKAKISFLELYCTLVSNFFQSYVEIYTLEIHKAIHGWKIWGLFLDSPVKSDANNCVSCKPLILLPVHYPTQITAHWRRHAPCTRLFRLQSLLKYGCSCRCSRWKTKIVWNINFSCTIIKILFGLTDSH